MVSSVSSTDYSRYTASSIFSRMDTDKSQGIDKNEFTSALSKNSESEAEKLFSYFDSDGDGTINETESEDGFGKLLALKKSINNEQLFGKMNGTNEMPPPPPPPPSDSDMTSSQDSTETEDQSLSIDSESLSELFEGVTSSSLSEFESKFSDNGMPPPPPPPPDSSMAGSQDSILSDIQSLSLDNESFSSLIDDIKSYLFNSEDGSSTNNVNSQIEQMISQIQNSINYGQNGFLSVNTSGTNSLFSASA